MIHADMKGKTHVPEDVLTSNCIGLLSLLPDNILIEFFSISVDLKGQNINLSKYDEIEKIEFWSWLDNAGEPDILCILKNKTDNHRLVLIIEVKHGSGKSGYAQTEIINSDEETFSTDQLAKYWQAARKQYNHANIDVALIYLTHHRNFPKQDIEDSLKETTNSGLIYWLSWFHLYEFVVDKLKVNLSKIEANIFKLLKIYLKNKGYQ
jgi:Holliday junction resolvase-like predicted endonuclease